MLAKLRAVLGDIAAGRGDARALAERALLLLGDVEDNGGDPPLSGRGEAEVEYVVEDSVNGAVLTEKRKTGRAYPFRCPESIYMALVDVLGKSDRAMPLDELIAAVTAVMGDPPPDYQVRVPLRFWLQVDPPLIARNRARYRPTRQQDFAVSAKSAWAALRKTS